MSIKMYLGSSGSGKSYSMYNEVIEESINSNDSFIIVVPEQFTMETQRDIVNMHPNRGTMNIDIVSFNRLAFRIFEELNIVNNKLLDDLGKTMIVRKLIEDSKNKLKIFGGCVDKIGFIDEVKSIISELYQYDIDVENIENLVKDIGEDELLSWKLQDIYILYSNFKEYIANEYIVSEEVMDILGDVAPTSNILRDSIICFDGFTGFTPIQYKLIERLGKIAKELRFTITISENHYKKGKLLPHDLFYLSTDTIDNINEIGKRSNIEISMPVICDNKEIGRFPIGEELSHLERNIFRYPYDKYEKEVENINVKVSRDVRQETYYVARNIKNMVMNEGYSYNDIAVVSGNLEDIEHIYNEIFPKFNIPYFIDTNISINNNPAIEAIKALFRISIDDFSYESVFRYLKTGISNIDDNDIEIMENYVLKYGVRGINMYNKEWRDKDIDNIKNVFLDEVKLLVNQDIKKITVLEYSKLLFDFIISIDIYNKLENEAIELEKCDKINESKIYKQVYDKIIDVLDKIVEILGDTIVSDEEYLQLIEEGLDSIDLGIIPPSTDRVIIGDIERTRLNHIKVLFFVQVNDGIIPKKGSDTGVFNDSDKEALEGCGLKLAPTNRQNSFTEQFYLYLNLTKAEERIYISYAEVDASGTSLKPSYIINRISNMFPQLVIDDRLELSKEEVNSIAEGNILILEGINNQKVDNLRDVYEASINSENTVGIDAILEGVNYTYRTKGLSINVAKQLYGENVQGSISKIESYANCPYSFYLRYGLELKEREIYQINNSNIGIVLHGAMERMFSYVNDNGDISWKELSDEQRDSLADRFLDEAIADEESNVFEDTTRNKYLVRKMRGISRRSIKTLQKQINSGSMQPMYFEKKFDGHLGNNNANIKLDNDSILQINGVIDRVDICEKDDKVYVSIVDYKSSKKDFDVNDFYNGLQLQLPIYMKIVLELVKEQYPNKEIIPTGMFYYGMSNNIVDADDRESAEAKIEKNLKLKGLVNEDSYVIDIFDSTKTTVLPLSVDKENVIKKTDFMISSEQFLKLGKYADKKLKEYGNSITEGNVDISPVYNNGYTPCKYCPYNSMCRFDCNNISNYRYIEKENSEQIWSEIDKE